MQGAVAAPTPSRPLGRTRRRSSSLSVISNASPSSPAASLWTDHRSPSKPGIKRMKRTRCTTGGESPLASHSPLKQALPLFEAPEEDLYYSSFWATPNPFALRTQAPPQAYPPSTVVPAPPAADASAAAAAFCASASQFALPSTSSRSRNASTDDAAALSSSNASLASSKGSFDDSSFASDSPGDSSLPSTSSSPQSPPPYPPSLLAATASSRGRTTLVLTRPSMRPPSLRRSSSCGGSPMLTESNTLPPVWDPVIASDDLVQELGQAESLHRAAFEQLRHATHAEGEGFVERMRRWETERSARDALFGLGGGGGGGGSMQSRVSDLAPSIGDGTSSVVGGDDDDDDDGDDEQLCEDDDDDEIDILLDPLDGDMLEFATTRPPPQHVSHAELDELAQRLRTGACEVEDYALVRDVQARYRTRTRSVA